MSGSGERLHFLGGIVTLVIVAVAIVPPLFVPSLVHEAAAVGAVLGLVIAAVLVVRGDDTRLRTQWVTWRDENPAAYRLVDGVFFGVTLTVCLALVMPPVSGDAPATRYTGSFAIVPIAGYAIGWMFFRLLFERVGPRLWRTVVEG